MKSIIIIISLVSCIGTVAAQEGPTRKQLINNQEPGMQYAPASSKQTSSQAVPKKDLNERMKQMNGDNKVQIATAKSSGGSSSTTLPKSEKKLSSDETPEEAKQKREVAEKKKVAPVVIPTQEEKKD